MTSSFFDEFYLVKPYSSRKANSETYLVGKGFNVSNVNDDIIDNPYIKIMLELIENWNSEPVLNHKDCPAAYMKKVLSASVKLTNSQIEKLKADITACNSGQMSLYRETFEEDIKRWYKQMAFKPVESSMQLRMSDAYNQKL